MSVLVKGMEMPESCIDCEIKQYDDYEDDCVCPFSGVVCLSIGRQDACPLVALPDHHGRLVDADALRDRLRNLADDDWNANTTTTWAEAFAECADMVDETPTIEPEPHWIPCSERLPEEHEVVLTQAQFKDDVKMAVSSRVDFNYWTGWGTRDINIVAWMPLPEPYREGVWYEFD